MTNLSEKPIRVLFISQECQVQHYTEQTEYAHWYEGAFAFYGGNRVHVGIAYAESKEGEGDSPCVSGHHRDAGITYFPLKVNLNYGALGQEWEVARCALLDVINQFEPDIVQCFGSEWPHAAIAEDIDVPVVVHMMGFLNIYYLATDMANGSLFWGPARFAKIRKLLFGWRNRDDVEALKERTASFERHVMKVNRFFIGRTEWDKNIVRYYSPGSRYFEVPEFIRLPFIREAGCWRYHFNGKLNLLTVASADDRKGIEIVLLTAKLLKELVGIDFEWRIAGGKELFERFERRCGIRHEDVNVRLLGMLGAEGVVDELKNADLLIHPSVIDNSPRVICEAQLVGCPTIASNVGGVAQLVEHDVTGFLYPYNEPHTLAFLIANLADRREVLEGVSENALRIARERHDPQTIISKMLDVYKEVLSTYEK